MVNLDFDNQQDNITFFNRKIILKFRMDDGKIQYLVNVLHFTYRILVKFLNFFLNFS